MGGMTKRATGFSSYILGYNSPRVWFIVSQEAKSSEQAAIRMNMVFFMAYCWLSFFTRGSMKTEDSGYSSISFWNICSPFSLNKVL